VVCEIGIAVQTARLSHQWVGSHGWGQAQPLKLDSVQDYIEAAYERRPAFRAIIEDFAKAAGYGVEIVAPCIKSEKSAERKLWDRTSTSIGRPDMIVDYLRARVLVPANPGALGQLSDAIDRFKDHPLMVGYKDRIYRPNGSGFRAINGLMDVDGMHSELQIIPDDYNGTMRTANDITENLRAGERAIRTFEESPSMLAGGAPKMYVRAEESIGLVRDFRKGLHDYAANKAGVDVWLDPEIAAKHEAPSMRELVAMHRDLKGTYFGRGLAARLQQPMQDLVASHVSSHRLTLQ
jgi:hypothetical protein